MNIKIKKLHKNAKMPYRANPTDAGADLVAVSKEHNSEYGTVTMGLGIALEIPKGYVGLLVNRSSCYKQHFTPQLGVIDSDYRGEIKAIFKNLELNESECYNIGDRVAQLLIVPIELATFTEVEDLSKTERGIGGFGSTGK